MLRLCFIFFIVWTTTGWADSGQKQQVSEFELLHLWRHKTEQHALTAISGPMRRQGSTWSESVVDTNFFDVRARFAQRFSLGVPPTGVFWIGGGESVRELLKNNIFRKIVTEGKQPDLARVLLPEIYETVRYEDGISMLPLGIHSQNQTVYNNGILNKVGAAPAQSWAEFVEMGKKARQLGYTGLSMSDELWQLRFLLNSILVEVLSSEQFSRLMKLEGPVSDWRVPLGSVFEILAQLRPLSNSDYRELAWWDAVGHVSSGRALANVLGDFTTPVYANGMAFTCAPSPGNKYALWSFDAIALTKTENPGEKLAQEQLIKVMTSSENMSKYMVRKGGIPVYQNVDPKSLNACSQKFISVWQESSDNIILTSEEWSGAGALIATVAQQFWRDFPEMTVDEAVDATMQALETASTSEKP